MSETYKIKITTKKKKRQIINHITFTSILSKCMSRLTVSLAKSRVYHRNINKSSTLELPQNHGDTLIMITNMQNNIEPSNKLDHFNESKFNCIFN